MERRRGTTSPRVKCARPQHLQSTSGNGAAYQQHLCELELEMTQLRTQLKETQQTNALLDHYQEMFERAPIGAMVLDEMGLVHDANWQLRLLLAPNLDRGVGGPFGRFVAHEKKADFLDHLQRAKLSSDPV